MFADTFKPSWCGSTDDSDDLPLGISGDDFRNFLVAAA